MSPPYVRDGQGFQNNNTFTGGQIGQFRSEWGKISSDPWLIDAIQGVAIPFVSEPVQLKEPHPYRLSEEESASVDAELSKFLEKKIVQLVNPEQGQVISNIFLRPKIDGGHCLILDLTGSIYM